MSGRTDLLDRSFFLPQQRSSGNSSLCGSGNLRRAGPLPEEETRWLPAPFLGRDGWCSASADPLVSATGDPSPAASLLWLYLVSPFPKFYYTIGCCPAPRPYTRPAAALSGVVSSSAASPRTSACANRARGPALATSSLDACPDTLFDLLCAAAAFVLPQRLRSFTCTAAPRPRRSTRPTESGNRGPHKENH